MKRVFFFSKETINISDIDTERALVSNEPPFGKESLRILLVINIWGNIYIYIYIYIYIHIYTYNDNRITEVIHVYVYMYL